MKRRDKAFDTKMSKLTDLVDYQDGAVVSREIINQKSGSVTLFAFDEGQGLSEHMAPFDAMVYLLDGEAKITISGNSLNLKQGEMIIMPANQLHSLKATNRFKMVLTMIKPCGQESQQYGTEDKG
jgi:quercetin dioxygenase-like cupin family protein